MSWLCLGCRNAAENIKHKNMRPHHRKNEKRKNPSNISRPLFLWHNNRCHQQWIAVWNECVKRCSNFKYLFSCIESVELYRWLNTPTHSGATVATATQTLSSWSRYYYPNKIKSNNPHRAREARPLNWFSTFVCSSTTTRQRHRAWPNNKNEYYFVFVSPGRRKGRNWLESITVYWVNNKNSHIKWWLSMSLLSMFLPLTFSLLHTRYLAFHYSY